MLKTKATIEYNGKTYDKIFAAGNIIKCEERNGKTFITLSHYKGKNNPSEYTNNIFVDDKKVSLIRGLKKGTQLFCDINVQKNTKDGKDYENLYLFNFEIGKEGNGNPFNALDTVQNFDEDPLII